MALGQLHRLPPELANNPFYPFLVKFSRLKMGSGEWMFTAEQFLLRYAWFALLILFVLVLPPLEEVDVISTVVRLSTLLYPCFFVWSLTRLSGVELMQCVLEGQWTNELLATPVDDEDLIHGFLTPLWLIIRQYALISIFSLFLYTLEAHFHVIIVDGVIFFWEVVRLMTLYYGLFFGAIAWIVFVYIVRLFMEVRLRSDLLKGIGTLFLLMGGFLIFVAYFLLFIFYPTHTTDTPVLAVLVALVVALALTGAWCYRRLCKNFRRYLTGQMDIDLLIFDEIDPDATGWTELENS